MELRSIIASLARARTDIDEMPPRWRPEVSRVAPETVPDGVLDLA
jgi:hypothetical protein